MERRCEVTRTSCVKLAHTRTRGPCLIMSLFSRFVFFFQKAQKHFKWTKGAMNRLKSAKNDHFFTFVPGVNKKPFTL